MTPQVATVFLPTRSLSAVLVCLLFAGPAHACPADEVPPAPPWGLMASHEEDGIHLTWNAPLANGSAEVLNYVVYRSENGSSFVAIAEVEHNAYVDPVDSADSVYTYLVTAVNSAGESVPGAVLQTRGIGYPYCNQVITPAIPPGVRDDCFLPPPRTDNPFWESWLPCPMLPPIRDDPCDLLT